VQTADRTILRELARRVAEIAALPLMSERKRLWRRHNSLRPVRPMVLVFPEGSWNELLPPSAIRCADETARHIEWELRSRIYQYEHFDSDNVVEREYAVHKVIRNSGWGLEPRWHPSGQEKGARGFDPVILEPQDLRKLRPPVITYDEPETQRRLSLAREIFGDILDVRLRGVCHVSFHAMNLYTGLRGLEQVMLDMYENPGMLHEAMAFLEQGYRGLIRQYQEQNLLDLNNDSTYHSSGGVGYIDDLPAPGYDPARVRPCDMWASAEAQELAQVSPEQHEEFVLQYERRLLEPFGLNGYGCCEDLTAKLDQVLRIPRLRRVSISPWANVALCAAKLGGRCIFSWKPHPSHLVGRFAPEAIEDYLAQTARLAREHGCVLEMILKDTHTCENRPERFDEWCRRARRAIARAV